MKKLILVCLLTLVACKPAAVSLDAAVDASRSDIVDASVDVADGGLNQ